MRETKLKNLIIYFEDNCKAVVPANAIDSLLIGEINSNLLLTPEGNIAQMDLADFVDFTIKNTKKTKAVIQRLKEAPDIRCFDFEYDNNCYQTVFAFWSPYNDFNNFSQRYEDMPNGGIRIVISSHDDFDEDETEEAEETPEKAILFGRC